MPADVRSYLHAQWWLFAHREAPAIAFVGVVMLIFWMALKRR